MFCIHIGIHSYTLRTISVILSGCLYGLNGSTPNWQFGAETTSPQNFEESGPFPAVTGDYRFYRSRFLHLKVIEEYVCHGCVGLDALGIGRCS